MNVALFEMCLNEQFHPQVKRAVRRVLEHYGCRVVVPRGQTCCGRTHFDDGYVEEARELAKRMVELFEGFNYVVTPSARCCAMVREHYVELLGEDPAWKHGVRKLAASTYEFVEFLAKVLKADVGKLRLPEAEGVTYHPSCGRRGVGNTDEPARMLKKLAGVEYRPLAQSDQCCGFGSTFAIQHQSISRAMGEEKVNCIAATGAGTVVCNEAGCALQLTQRAEEMEVALRVKHVAEILAEAIAAGENGKSE